jgi:hypothetical protein
MFEESASTRAEQNMFTRSMRINARITFTLFSNGGLRGWQRSLLRLLAGAHFVLK